MLVLELNHQVQLLNKSPLQPRASFFITDLAVLVGTDTAHEALPDPVLRRVLAT